ncbi:LuxR C-terminal-related transcriptional regulator [Echinicola soli]|nr:LuxR C-terminal-related transcriptional regulator [Echinicola soli]
MEKLILDEARQIWREIAQHKAPGKLELEVDLYKKLINFFQVGDYYYMVFNPPEMTIEFTSESIADILGYPPEDFTLELLTTIIHPDDLPHFINFEATVTQFWGKLSPDKVFKYKSRYDYRVKKANGKYIRILQQIITIQSDEQGAVLRTFVVHTDISHLKKDHKMVLSFIGLEGEPSYLDVRPIEKLKPAKTVLTKREMEVLGLLAQNHRSKTIAQLLCISKETVSSHRKNMLRKTGTHTVLQLVTHALERGWI